MYCWSCGHKNPENNKFCGECGKVQVRPDLIERRSETIPANKDVKPVVETPRVARSEMFGESTPELIGRSASPPAVPVTPAEEKTVEAPVKTAPSLPPIIATEKKPQVEVIEKESKKEKASPDAPATFAPVVIPAVVAPPLQRVQEPSAFRSPEGFHDSPVKEQPARTLTPNRITGPSFLGLSDEPNTTSGGDYLLDDEYSEPASRSWRGWIAVALLLVFGILAYRQWNYMKATANELAQTTGIMNPNYGSQPTPLDPPKESAAKPKEAKSAAEAEDAKLDATESAKRKEESSKPAEAEPQTAAADRAEETAAGDAGESSNAVEKPENDAPAAKPSPKRAARESDEPPAPRVENAQLLMAQNYLQGRNGYQQDCGRGMSILRSAAKEPNAKARIQMAALYASGTCVMQNRPEAYHWFARAQEIEPRNTWIERNLNRLWEDMTDEERRRAER